MIEEFAASIPARLLDKSGSVFYSGRAAFASPSGLYVLGLNPGGSPIVQANETVGWHTNKVLNQCPDEWSAYSDENWGGPPGGRGLQPRVLHMFRRLGLDARRVPSSNVVFLRSVSESTLEEKFDGLAAEIWPFHQRVIDKLEIRVILCFGAKAGTWIARQLGAMQSEQEFVEQNNRRWRTRAFVNGIGHTVIVATHPSRANWVSPSADPTALIKTALSS